MPRQNHFLNSFLSVILILSLTLMNVNVALADDGTTPEPQVTAEPTEEPVQPTPEPTEPPVEATESPVVDTPAPTEVPIEQAPATEPEEAAPIAELLTQAPENTDLVVLDENGEALSLTSQEALNTILETDPMWCPAGVLPGARNRRHLRSSTGVAQARRIRAVQPHGRGAVAAEAAGPDLLPERPDLLCARAAGRPARGAH